MNICQAVYLQLNQYVLDRKEEGIDATLFCCPNDTYNEVWQFLETNSTKFKSSDLVIINNWYKTPLVTGPRQAFKNWNEKQTRFEFEEFTGFATKNYNVKIFLVLQTSPGCAIDADYSEWSD